LKSFKSRLATKNLAVVAVIVVSENPHALDGMKRFDRLLIESVVAIVVRRTSPPTCIKVAQNFRERRIWLL
jgi:hypothetical protein